MNNGNDLFTVDFGALTQIYEADSFVKQGESIIDQLDGIDNRIVEMQKSEYCYVNVFVIRQLISKLKAEIDDMVHSGSDK